MPINAIKQFLKLESASGIILLAATVLAIICNNSGLDQIYDDFLNVNMAFVIGTFSLSKPILLWVNDGLMTIFFLLVALELKREIVEGELKDPSRVSLPIIAAIGGMLAPALLYLFFTHHHPVEMHGWAIPTATDIAFALGILSLFGNRIPTSLKLFLLMLAIVDDLGAIIIIAFFHSGNLSLVSMAFSVAMILLLVLMNRLGVKKITAFALVGILLWLGVLQSGIHATLAGVILGFAIPLKSDEGSPLKDLEETIHPWVAFLVMPLFAFANAGLSFKGVTLATFQQPVVLGIIAGLFIGKQVGVMLATWLVVKLRWSALPAGCSWLNVYGVALICGVGFTMSLFIGSLAFHDLIAYHAQVRLGVLAASVLSGVLGYLVLLFSL